MGIWGGIVILVGRGSLDIYSENKMTEHEINQMADSLKCHHPKSMRRHLIASAQSLLDAGWDAEVIFAFIEGVIRRYPKCFKK